ncbi:UDP-N-acetylmuramyl pentapeptide phosphotransferase [Microbacterium marinilacus]|uniref:UDP-N-acetylmuramyl pentapeptide phosphotransferase n=1 Tax=Microbacterium marinilacus TaxID=415209 RepID=A0ABP7B8B8_9MICO|nr:UDP-N-acetylmuramyl pentapeptide phosphotransferase [Microbacterium marinilacus]MBY0687444.1 UDP-N-acetylmuramyl pentapeptide phosphotransferase [Microbacterium marinilacus]
MSVQHAPVQRVQAPRQTAPRPAAQPTVTDPARRPDVLLRVRRPPGQEASAWWFVGAFLVFSGAVTALLSFFPG